MLCVCCPNSPQPRPNTDSDAASLHRRRLTEGASFAPAGPFPRSASSGLASSTAPLDGVLNGRPSIPTSASPEYCRAPRSASASEGAERRAHHRQPPRRLSPTYACVSWSAPARRASVSWRSSLHPAAYPLATSASVAPGRWHLRDTTQILTRNPPVLLRPEHPGPGKRNARHYSGARQRAAILGGNPVMRLSRVFVSDAAPDTPRAGGTQKYQHPGLGLDECTLWQGGP